MKDNSKVGVSVYGGATTTSTGDATANTVTLSGNASVGFAAGWDWTVAHAYGGFSKYGKAESNSVTMKEDSKNRFIAYGGQSENNAANLNKVFLSDNSQSGYAIGGEGVTGMNANEVHLSGSAKVTGDVAGVARAHFLPLPPLQPTTSLPWQTKAMWAAMCTVAKSIAAAPQATA